MAQKYIRGLEIIIQSETAEGTFKDLAGQRGCTLNRSGEVIDVSNKVTSGWKESLTGLKEWSIDADGIMVEGDEALDLLEQAFLDSKPVHVKMGRRDASWGYEGEAIITDFPIEAPFDDAVTYSMTLQGASGLEKFKKPGEVDPEGKTTLGK